MVLDALAPLAAFEVRHLFPAAPSTRGGSRP
jgi:hypothetical protein